MREDGLAAPPELRHFSNFFRELTELGNVFSSKGYFKHRFFSSLPYFIYVSVVQMTLVIAEEAGWNVCCKWLPFLVPAGTESRIVNSGTGEGG